VRVKDTIFRMDAESSTARIDRMAYSVWNQISAIGAKA
jgi:hypothetical protein